jgi:hypothetical protein
LPGSVARSQRQPVASVASQAGAAYGGWRAKATWKIKGKNSKQQTVQSETRDLYSLQSISVAVVSDVIDVTCHLFGRHYARGIKYTRTFLGSGREECVKW